MLCPPPPVSLRQLAVRWLISGGPVITSHVKCGRLGGRGHMDATWSLRANRDFGLSRLLGGEPPPLRSALQTEIHRAPRQTMVAERASSGPVMSAGIGKL